MAPAGLGEATRSPEPGTPSVGRAVHDDTAGKVDEIGQSFIIPVQPLAAETAENAVLGPINAHNVDYPSSPSSPSEASPLLGSREAGWEAGQEEEEQVEMEFMSDTHPQRFWICFSIILANLFIAAADGTIMASSHPVITSHFQAANSATWLSTSFLLTSTTFQPLLGRLSDAIGRKPLFILCSFIFLVSIIWCALAQSIQSLIAARALSGLGCGGSTMIGAILTSDLVSISRRGTYQSYINMVTGTGSALGVAFGGFLAETIGWRWEFGVQVPLLVLVTGVAVIAIPDGIGAQEQSGKSRWAALRKFDTKGSILLTISLAFLILGINLGGNNLPWAHPFVITSLAICAIGFPIFLFVETKVEKPIMPLGPLRTAPRANLIFSNFIVGLIYSCILFNMPLYFQAVLLSNATDSGLRLVLPTILASGAGALTGQLITRTRRLKWPVGWGSVLFFTGCISLCLLRRGLPEAVYVAVQIPSSVGIGFLFPGAFMGVLTTSRQSEQAVITSMLILWRSLGLVIGVAYSGLVVQNALPHYLRLYVDAPDKEELIAKVRRSVELVAKLEEPVRSQVASSYEASIRLSFIICVLFAAVAVALVLPIKLPRLPRRK